MKTIGIGSYKTLNSRPTYINRPNIEVPLPITHRLYQITNFACDAAGKNN